VEIIPGLVLDFDGVLANTVGTHTEARMEAFSSLGFDVSSDTHEEAHRHGSHPEQIIGWILKQAGIIDHDADIYTDPVLKRVVDEKKRLYKDHASNGLNAVPGAPQFVEWAAQEYGNNLAIATTASRIHEVNPYLSRYGLYRHFRAIAASEDTPQGRSKPDGFIYEEAARRLDLDPRSLACVEDTPIGIMSAQAADFGVRVGITTTHSRSDLAIATHVVDSFSELPELLRAIA